MCLNGRRNNFQNWEENDDKQRPQRAHVPSARLYRRVRRRRVHVGPAPGTGPGQGPRARAQGKGKVTFFSYATLTDRKLTGAFPDQSGMELRLQNFGTVDQMVGKLKATGGSDRAYPVNADTHYIWGCRTLLFYGSN